ncbi:MAG: branched-chain amino acid transferase [Hyphomicrobiales bacterium]|nr:MAG: branched-chain amino acid transferase [Hyphomicrobiales bacterium]
MNQPSGASIGTIYGADAPVSGIAYVGGAYMPLAEASIPMVDRGFVRSDATYDVVHVWNGRFFRLDDYVERFWRSMTALRMEIPHSQDEVKAILHQCVRRSGLKDAYVQMTCTRGIPPKGSRDPRACANQFTAFAQPFVWIANEEQRRRGLHVTVSSVQRIPPQSIDPRIKNFHWLDMTMALFEAYERNAEVPVLPDAQGNVTEGPGFNIFALSRGRLVTPDRGMFEGITRRTVIELAEDLQMPVEVRALPAQELARADEIFLTSTAGGIMPVTRLDGAAVGAGTPGRATMALHDLYWRRHDEGWKSTPVAGEAA